MKTAFSLLALIATIGLAHAGGFGGPPPFTNGSPLASGVDGTYQASARGNNLSGVISFTYSGGIQTGGNWVVFYQGQVFAGSDTVAIMDGSISGVLDSFFGSPVAITNSTTSTTAAGTSSSSTVVAYLTSVNGYFDATLDNNSPTGAFSGKGELAGVAQTTVTTAATNGDTSETVSTETVTAKFKVKGVRAAI